MNLVDKFTPVVAIPPQAGAAITGDYISLKQANHVAVMVTINQANAATVAITIEQATDVSGTSSKALAKDVPIYLTADAATSDIPARQTAGVAYTTTADVKQKVVVFEIDAEDLDGGVGEGAGVEGAEGEGGGVGGEVEEAELVVAGGAGGDGERVGAGLREDEGAGIG